MTLPLIDVEAIESVIPSHMGEAYIVVKLKNGETVTLSAEHEIVAKFKGKEIVCKT